MSIAWGIIGAGSIADRQAAPAIRQAEDQRLVAVMGRDPTKLRAFAAKHGVARSYTTVPELLADEAVNAVYIATPPYLHAEQTIAAAQQGKHVLCEKPLALDTTQATQMIDACRASGVRLMVCYYQRYNPRHQQIKALLAAGVIGQVTALRINFSDYFPPQPGFWHHDPAVSGGGSLMDLGVHCIDLVRYLGGPVRAVTALVDTLAADSAVEDTATLLLKLAGGAHAVVTAHWSTANFAPEQGNALEICGTAGTIFAAPIQAKDSTGVLRLVTVDGVTDLASAAEGRRPHVALLEDFAAALHTGAPTPIPGEEGRAGLAVIEAAHRSARTGQRVAVEM
jgi:1,5-anhydro-D-fructose reductase (1,5-anhydro-D-mannitol-forming)